MRVTATGILALAAVGGLGYLAWRWYVEGGGLTVPDAINPASPDNLVYRGVNAMGEAVISPTGPGRNADGSWNLGAWLFDVTHPGWAEDAIATVPGPGPAEWSTGGGRWNNPSAYTTPGVTGDGGAAFGIYPKP